MISVIIPLYNQADKIGRTLDSILKQTYQDIEVIIVDDGSQDDISLPIQEYCEKFKDKNIVFKCISQKNAGAPSARNHGFRQSSGDMLFFCDADSYIKPDAFQVMKITLETNPGVSYVYSSFMWGKKLFQVGEFSVEKLRTAPCIHTMSMIKRNDFPVTGWDENIKKLQDWDLWLTMLEQGHVGKWINQVLFSITPGGVYSNWLPSFAYQLLPWLPNVKKYNQAVAKIKLKHKI